MTDTRRFTKKIIKMGKAYRKDIVIKAYGGVELTIRPATEEEVSLAAEASNYSIDQIIGGVDLSKFTEEELEAIKNTGDIPPNLMDKVDLSGVDFSPRLTRFMRELSKRCIVPQNEEEDVGDLLIDAIGFPSIEIGTAIMAVSNVTYEEIADFFNRQTASSSVTSTQQDTGSQTI